MDFLKNAASQAMSGQNQNQQQSGSTNQGGGGYDQNTNQNQFQGQQQNQGQAQQGGGFMDKLQNMGNNALGGGQQGEAKEDGLDKAVDMFQEKFMAGGDQSNESAAEQAKDEMISDQIRSSYKTATGKDFFIADKN